MAIKIAVIVAYALTVIIVGILALKKTKSFSDFFLGGGNVGPIMSAFSYGTAYFSAVLFIGFAGKIGWAFGLSSLWIAIGNTLIGVLGVWWLLGKRIKNMSVEYNVTTMSEFFEKRYDSKFLKIFSSISIFIFFIPYSAAVFMGLSYLFESNFQIEYWVALCFMGSFTAIYLILGGYKAMAMIDIFFGMIMSVGVLILLASTIQKGQGIENITTQLESINPKLIQAVGPPGLWPLFCLIFLTSIAPFGMPQLIQKFYAIKDTKSIKIGMLASTVFAFLIGSIAYFVGSTTRIFLSPETTPNAFKDGKPLFDALMPELLTNIVPDSLSIILLLVILSASMSTLAALVLISSSSIVKDIYSGIINKNTSDKSLTLLMRFASAFFILLSVILAYFKPASIVSILGISWGAIGSVFLGPFIWGLFSKKSNKYGAITASILGLSVCLILYVIGFSSPEAGTLGMITSLVTPIFFIIVQRPHNSETLV